METATPSTVSSKPIKGPMGLLPSPQQSHWRKWPITQVLAQLRKLMQRWRQMMCASLSKAFTSFGFMETDYQSKSALKETEINLVIWIPRRNNVLLPIFIIIVGVDAVLQENNDRHFVLRLIPEHPNNNENE